MAEGHVIVDTRSSAEFGAGHIAGAYNVQMSSSEFEQRVGWVVPDDTPIILVTDKRRRRAAVHLQHGLYRPGPIRDRLSGRRHRRLDGRWRSRCKLSRKLMSTRSNTSCRTNGLQVLDVRDREEWDEGHIEGAHFMAYTSMAPQLNIPAQIDTLTLNREQTIAVTCATGKRSVTAISMLLQNGYKHLYNVTGGMEAWENAGFPMLDGAGNLCNI